MLKKFISAILIILHLATFGPVRQVLAYNASSVSYKLTSGATNEGGKDRSGATIKLWQDEIAEPCVGKVSSPSYVLQSGFIPTVSPNPPVLNQDIPYQSWPLNTSKPNAFDLDDYFISLDGYALTYSYSGNSQIQISIDPLTHTVSFSQGPDWTGAEKVYFSATDPEGNTIQSSQVDLQVENPNANDQPVIVGATLSPISIKEGDLITMKVKAKDLDNDTLKFSYSVFFTPTPRNTWLEAGYWYSESLWQTSSTSKGHYLVKVTVTDTAGLTDTEDVLVNVGNFNHPPVLNPILDITANEGSSVVITPSATDLDNDALRFYYSSPFDSAGKWLTDYNSAGIYTVTITASDSIDTVSQAVKVTINNTNQAPTASLSLSKYTVSPNEEILITVNASDYDNDSMSFVLNKDGTLLTSGPITSTYTTTTSFSAIADHTIAVTVTDSGGLAATASSAVDVVDPNANRDSINPVMGDFNGDALSDLGLHNSDTGTWEIALSDKGSFTAALDWLTNFGTTKDWQPVGGDFNGDARTDIGIYNNITGQLQIALSSGTGFTSSGAGLTAAFANYSWQPFSGNFNADKYTDFALYNRDTGEVRVALGNGAGFGSLNTWSTNLGTNYIALGGDFNGDSLTDLGLFNKTNGEFKVSFSNSESFVDSATWLTGYAIDKDPILSDFNNDGLTDIGYWDKLSLNWYYAISSGTSFVDKGVWLANFGTSLDESATTGDFDGNGITDAASFDRDQLGITRWKTKLSTIKPADLLTQIDNGIGGKTQVTYSYAASSDNPGLPFPVYVASSTSLINTFPVDRPATYTQNFSFSGGYYDAAEREFRGFEKVKAVDPITNNYSETYFYQGKPDQEAALKGQIQKTLSYDGNLKLISQTLNTYEVRKAGGSSEKALGFPMLISSESTVYEENQASVSTKNSFSYDNIGNLLEAKQEGDILKLGDEKSSSTTYNQAYTVDANGQGLNRPKEVLLKDKDLNPVSKKTFDYDLKGNLIKEIVPIFNSITQVTQETQVTYSYDSFGNLITSTNALGQVVSTDYETIFYAYPQKVTNFLGQSVSYVYEPKFGVVKSVTDTNGISSSTTYDSLARVIQVTNGLNQVVTTYSYPDFNTKITTNAIGLSAAEYLDGLGRGYKTVSSGEDGTLARQVVSEVFYNNRGLTEKESLAHYLDADPGQISYIVYEYDIRARVKKTISDFPGITSDAQSSINYLSPLSVETTDPQGHRKATLKDVYGNILEVIEYAGLDGVFHTYYEYDIQNNLTKTTDNQGNSAQIFYDSIGRKLKMIDPDMGTWSYEYDLLGNLIKQTDAKGQVLSFEYDSLNRLTRKLANLQTLATYIYDDPLKPNCIGRLSKVIDNSGSSEFFYDSLGREVKSIKEVSGVKYQVSREYDILDRLTTLTYPDGEIVNYSYDLNSGLLEKVSNSTNSINYVNSINYNASGQIKSLSYGNNVQTAYTYGPDLRLSRIYTQNASLNTLQDLNYLFDKNGNLTTLTDNLRSNIRSFSYDDLDRLTQAQNLPAPAGGYTNYHYQYDSIGNLLYKSDTGVLSYGLNAGPHALTSAGGYSYSYDANGNLLSGKNKTFEYDAENRLSKVTESGIISSFSYDGDGGRVKQSTVNGLQSKETIYIGSLFETISSTSQTGQTSVTSKHIFAGANRVCTITKDEGRQTTDASYYHSDHLGSSSVVTDASGNQVEHYEYTPYGGIAVQEFVSRPSSLVRHLYTGKELDSTGLYFYGARYYDPEIGRFITADTIVQAPYDPQSLNRYAYARNNPIKYVDPNGRWFWIAIIIGAILGGVSSAVSGEPVWKGMLMGALGGALVGAGAAGFGFWGAVAGGMFAGAGNAAVNGGNIGFGALVGGLGAGLGYGLGSWASNWNSGSFWGELGGAAFAGAIAGGVGAELQGGDFGRGAGMGAAYSSAGFLGSYGLNSLDPKVVKARGYEREVRERHALNIKKNDMIKIPVGSRSAVGPAGHRFLEGWEMGPNRGPIATTNTVKDLSGWDTNIATQKAGNARFATTEVSASGLVEAIALYEQTWVDSGTGYSAGSYNSNYAVNTVIYSAGGSVPGGLGWTPEFRTQPLYYLPNPNAN